MNLPTLHGFGQFRAITAIGEYVSYGAVAPDGRSVVVRTHASELPTPAVRATVRRQFELLSAVRHPGLAPAVELIDEPTRCALVAEVPPGPSLAHTDLRSLSIADVLQLVIDVAPALGGLHVQGVGHGGIDLFTLHRGVGQNGAAQLESPWSVDSPPSPHGDTASLSRLISTVIARSGQRLPQGLERLLQAAATGDDSTRYRSVVGFAHDLRRCRDELRDSGLCPAFDLATDRFALRWKDPTVGPDPRADERDVVAALELEGGHGPRVVVVEGPAGIGRSTCLRGVAAILRRNGVGVGVTAFNPGSAQPLGAPLRLVREIVAELVDGPAVQREAVVAGLRDGLGEDIAVAVALLPPLGRLLSVPAATMDGSAMDVRARVERAARRVVHAFVSVADPFVAIFDDAESADAGSLAAIRTLAADDAPLRLVLGRRTGVVDTGLDETLAQLERRGVPVRTIAVRPLSHADLHRIVAEGLGLGDAECAPLASALWRRSNGNPGLAIADLQALIADGVVTVDPATARWSWEPDALEDGRDGIDDVDRRRIERLPLPSRQVLAAIAVAGRLATPAVVAAALDRPADSIAATLDQLATDQLLVWRSEASIRFHDDGLRRAAAQAADPALIAALRMRVGRTVLNDHMAAGEAGIDDGDRFDVLELLAGQEHSLSAVETAWAADWAEVAARVAHGGGAYAAALELQLRAIAMLGPLAWEEHRDRIFELHLRAAENALVIDRTTLVDQLLDTAWAHHPTPLQRVRALRVLGNRWWTRQDQRGGLEEMNTLLRELGERFPTKATAGQVAKEFVAARWALRHRTPESFLRAPALTDELVRAKLDTMLSAVHLAYTTEPLTHVLLVLRGIRLTARHGVNVSSSYFVAGYGLLLCGLGKRFDVGVRYGRVGLELAERTSGPVRTMVTFAHHGFIGHWGEPLAATVEPLLAEYRQGLAIGRGGYAHSAGAFAMLHALLSSRPLPDVIGAAEQLRGELDRLDEHAFVLRLRIVLQTATDLAAGLGGRPPLAGECFDADQWFAAKRRRGELALIIRTLQAHVSLAAGMWDDAAAAVRACASEVRLAPGEAIVGVHHFQVALLSRLGVGVAGRTGRRSLRFLRRAATANPGDFAHRLALVEAVGDADALRRAADVARQNGHLADLALAAGLAAATRGAGDAISDRNAALLAWGATGTALEAPVLHLPR